LCSLREKYAKWIELEDESVINRFGPSKGAVTNSFSLHSVSYSVSTMGKSMLVRALQKSILRYEDLVRLKDKESNKGEFLDSYVHVKDYYDEEGDQTSVTNKFLPLRRLPYHLNLVSFIGHIPVPDATHPKKKYVLLTEYANNQTVPCLHEAITHNPPIKLGILLKTRVAQDILNAMNWLHDVSNLNHLRLKPSNILFFSFGSDKWRCKVADFALGPIEVFNSKQKGYSHAQYFAPELCRNEISNKKAEIDKNEIDKKADVWSYGMLLYTLFTYKEPFPKMNDDEVKKKVGKIQEKEVIDLFNKENKNLGNTLTQLLLDCCKPDPSQRISFKEILEKSDKLFPKILVELDVTESISQKIWDDAILQLKPQEKGILDFKGFFKFLCDKYFILKPKTEERHYLKAALRLPYMLKQGQDDPKNITLENFRIVCNIFKLSKNKDDTFIRRIVEVFKAEWFYGSVDRLESQRQLEVQADKKKRTLTTLLCAMPIPGNCVLHTKKRMVTGKIAILSRKELSRRVI